MNDSQKEFQRKRVKIANIVARSENIDKHCVLCGKPGNILHNREDEYYITFICQDCKKDPINIEKAKYKSIDVRSYLDKQKLHTKNFLNDEVIKLVEKYTKTSLSLGVYCEQEGISRYQFNQLLIKYKTITGKEVNVKKHANKIQAFKTLFNR